MAATCAHARSSAFRLSRPLLPEQLAEQVALAKRSNQETGLTASQVEELFKVWGKNELPEKIRNPFLIFLSCA